MRPVADVTLPSASIPNFVGNDKAADRLADHPMFQAARTVKVLSLPPLFAPPPMLCCTLSYSTWVVGAVFCIALFRS